MPATTERLPVEVVTPTIASAVIVTVPQPVRRRFRLSPAMLVTACVVAGLVFRLGVYLRNPSLWIDEAMLAVNVVERSPAQLAGPLELNQGAPLGFLLASRTLVAEFGPSELVLRFVPFVASVVGFLLFVGFAYRVLSVASARMAVVLFAISPHLAGYAAEFKQYELDAAVAVGLLALGRRTWADGTGRVRLAIAGAVAVWFSHPAAFVLGGVGGVLLSGPSRRRNVLVVAAWLASFAACYAFFLRKLGQNGYLTDFWAGTFLPLSPGGLPWLVHHFVLLFDKPGGFGGEVNASALAAVCFLVGVLSLARTDRRLVVAVVTPLGLALAASAVRKYPFAGRLMLFVVPLLLLPVAHGAITIADRLRGLGAWWVVVAAVCVAPLLECNHLRKQPLHDEGSREVFDRLRAGWQTGDTVYLSHGAVPGFRHYAPPVPPAAVTFGRGPTTDLPTEPGRVWVVLAHFRPEEEAAVRATLDCRGTGEVVERRPDAVLMRYELRPADPIVPGPRSP